MNKRYFYFATGLIMLGLFTGCLCPFHGGRDWGGGGGGYHHGGGRR